MDSIWNEYGMSGNIYMFNFALSPIPCGTYLIIHMHSENMGMMKIPQESHCRCHFLSPSKEQIIHGYLDKVHNLVMVQFSSEYKQS